MVICGVLAAASSSSVITSVEEELWIGNSAGHICCWRRLFHIIEPSLSFRGGRMDRRVIYYAQRVETDESDLVSPDLVVGHWRCTDHSCFGATKWPIHQSRQLDLGQCSTQCWLSSWPDLLILNEPSWMHVSRGAALFWCRRTEDSSRHSHTYTHEFVSASCWGVGGCVRMRWDFVKYVLSLVDIHTSQVIPPNKTFLGPWRKLLCSSTTLKKPSFSAIVYFYRSLGCMEIRPVIRRGESLYNVKHVCFPVLKIPDQGSLLQPVSVFH